MEKIKSFLLNFFPICALALTPTNMMKINQFYIFEENFLYLNLQLQKNAFEDETDPIRLAWTVEEFEFFEVDVGIMKVSALR